MKLPEQTNDVICFSHLRWDFVYQRPQHLMSRFAQRGRVFFFEEPEFDDGCLRLNVTQTKENLFVVRPVLPEGLSSTVAQEAILADLLGELIADYQVDNFMAWYYTPQSLPFSRGIAPAVTVYDCMDQLTAFKNAPKSLSRLEKELFERADIVFTGGVSLYEAKAKCHPSVHAFPSSIDRAHFAQAREALPESDDQASIPHPRMGFIGVIDERFDSYLLDEISKARPDWNFVIVGPVVKIDPATLPQRENIFYLGGKSYEQLPSYLASWDAALLLFARNEATRYISPTKTPEYLAAGRPVVSTSIRDVVRPYGDLGLVDIADEPGNFVRAVERALLRPANDSWRKDVDDFLALSSWDQVWESMSSLIHEARRNRPSRLTVPLLAETEATATAASMGT